VLERKNERGKRGLEIESGKEERERGGKEGGREAAGLAKVGKGEREKTHCIHPIERRERK